MKSNYEVRAKKFIKAIHPYIMNCSEPRQYEYGCENFVADHPNRVVACYRGISRVAIVTADYVIKIDYNVESGFGSCETELENYNTVKECGFEKYFAKISRYTYDNRDYYIMPKVNGIDEDDEDAFCKCDDNDELCDFLYDHFYDLHSGNYGWKDGHIVIFDYATQAQSDYITGVFSDRRSIQMSKQGAKIWQVLPLEIVLAIVYNTLTNKRKEVKKMCYFETMGMLNENDRFCVLDTETTNGYTDEKGRVCLDDSMTYDISAIIIDMYGNIYDRRKYVCNEIFNSSLMLSAFFANKIPEYVESINNGEMSLMSMLNIYYDFRCFLKEYDVKAVMAHNCKFDIQALNNTLRYLTGSRKRWFFPYGLPIWDTQMMARETICQREDYIKFCKNNGYMTKHYTPRPRETAEILYRYISGNNDFIEVHKGFDDILIEKEIFVESTQEYFAGLGD